MDHTEWWWGVGGVVQIVGVGVVEREVLVIVTVGVVEEKVVVRVVRHMCFSQCTVGD